MAVEKTTTDSSPIEMLESVMLSIINNDGFALPTQQSKLCLELAFSLQNHFTDALPVAKSIQIWLVN